MRQRIWCTVALGNVSDGPVATQAALEHPSQHRDDSVDIVIDLDNPLVLVQSV